MLNALQSRPGAAILAAFAVIYFVWGSTYYAILVALESMPPFLMSGVRSIAAGLILALFARWREGTFRVDWWRALLLGTLFFPMGQGIVTWSERWLPSGTVALLVATVPLWVALLDWIGGQRPSAPIAVGAGLALGLVGVGILCNPPATPTGIQGSLLHVAITIGAALAWSTGTILSRRTKVSDSLLAGTASKMLAGGVVLVIVGAGGGERLDPGKITAASFAAFAYLTIFGSILAFSCYTWLLERVPAYRVASYAYVNPLVAVAFGGLFAGEAIDGRIAGAASLIVAAVALVVLSGRKTALKEVPATEPPEEPIASTLARSA